MYKRPIYKDILARAKEPRRFMQVLLGPRQVGKTTMILEMADELEIKSHYASADRASLEDVSWLISHWQTAREMAREENEAIFIIDEVQKIPHWADVIKQLWDEDSRNKLTLKIFMLGSSPWLIQKGIAESLAGRFEVIPITHWSFSEMQACFNWQIEDYIYFGAYPGAAPLADRKDPLRFRNYVADSLIETTISRDILLMTQVNKPALLRRLFQLGCDYSGQVLSYQKIIGQLQDAGNTTTLAHYLELLDGAGLLAGIPKYAGQAVRKRGSSPRFMVYNTALISAQSQRNFDDTINDSAYWGHLVESSIGSHLLNSIRGTNIHLYYWREANKEVDFILQDGKRLIAIEVKSGKKRDTLSGLKEFNNIFKPEKILLIGNEGISIENFLTKPAKYWLED
jgi:predicted AAA+ superfamily ATPase